MWQSCREGNTSMKAVLPRSLLLHHFSKTSTPVHKWFSCHSFPLPHALWKNGIKIVLQLLMTRKGNRINKLLTSAISEWLLFLLLADKSLPGEAPFAELAPVPPAPAQANLVFSQSREIGFFSRGGIYQCTRRAGAQGNAEVNGELLSNANQSHKKPRKSRAPRRVVGCAYMSQQCSPGQACLGGACVALRTSLPVMTQCLCLPGKPLKCSGSNWDTRCVPI